MAAQAPRSIANMVFVVLLALALAAFVMFTADMVNDVLVGPS